MIVTGHLWYKWLIGGCSTLQFSYFDRWPITAVIIFTMHGTVSSFIVGRARRDQRVIRTLHRKLKTEQYKHRRSCHPYTTVAICDAREASPSDTPVFIPNLSWWFVLFELLSLFNILFFKSFIYYLDSVFITPIT